MLGFLEGIDWNSYLTDPTAMVGAIVAILGLLVTLFTTLGWKKAANVTNTVKESLSAKEKEIVEATDVITTLIKGIEKAKDAHRPLVENYNANAAKKVSKIKNVGQIVGDFAASSGTAEELEKYVSKTLSQ